MGHLTKHRRAAIGNRALFDGRELTVHTAEETGLTLCNDDHTEYVGVFRGDKRLRVEPGTTTGAHDRPAPTGYPITEGTTNAE